jgi:secreted PhoX family phosphatase
MDVDDEYSATNMFAIICGQPMDVDEFNECSLDNIANPDNVAVMDEHDILIIGEDTTSGHQNDVVWSYNLNDGNLTRIVTTPYGAETTSPYWYPDINGFAYITAVAQHPYDETDEDKVDPAVNPDTEGADGYIGYFVMPSNAIKGKDLTFEGIPTATTNKEKSQFYGSPSVTACPKGESQETFVTPAPPAMEGSEEESAPAKSGEQHSAVLSFSAIVAVVALLFF